jgi:hypothetical protein
MSKPTITFSTLVDKLRQQYGSPAALPSTDPAKHSAFATIGTAGILPDVSAEKLLNYSENRL